MTRIVIAAGVAAGGLLLSGQNKPEVDPSLVPVQTILTVEARHDPDKNIPSLNREDVMAYEGHTGLPVTDLVSCTGENAGLELYVLIDDASSTIVGSQFDDLRRFIEGQPATTAIGIGYMHNGFVEAVRNLTTDHAAAARSLRLPMPFGQASPYLALSDIIHKWPESTWRHEVVMVSSGVDPLGGLGPVNPYMDMAIEDAQRREVVVYAIYMPSEGHSGHSLFRISWAQSHLAQLAEETGGEAYMLGFGPPVSFAPYLDEIAARLANQYRVTFLVKPEKKGGFRTVRLTTEAPNAELVGPAKVWAPAGGK
jgi:hypothetical protein